MTYDELLAACLALPEDNRRRLANELFASFPDPGWDEAWAEKIQKRIDDLDTGRVNTIPGDEVMARLRARHGKPRLG